MHTVTNLPTSARTPRQSTHLIVAAEHFVCDQHGQEFAARHRIEIEPSPSEPSSSRGRPGAGGGSR